MTDIPDALVEKAAAAVAEADYAAGRGILNGPDARFLARAALAAVWPDLPAARPVVDAERLADVLDTHTRCYGISGVALADAILASGVVRDAVDVRRAVAEPLLALADEMENPNAEHGTMPGVRMQVRRYWAGRIRAALDEGDEEPCAEFGSHPRGEHARMVREAATR